MQNGNKFPVTIQQMLEKSSSTAAIENSDRLENVAERYENHHPIQNIRAFDADEFCETDELQESAEECDRLERIAESCEEEYRAKDEDMSLAETADAEHYDALEHVAEGYENCHPVQALRPFNMDELRAMDGPQESEECKRMDQVAQKYEEQHSKNVASSKRYSSLSAGEPPKDPVFQRALDIIGKYNLCDPPRKKRWDCLEIQRAVL